MYSLPSPRSLLSLKTFPSLLGHSLSALKLRVEGYRSHCLHLSPLSEVDALLFPTVPLTSAVVSLEVVPGYFSPKRESELRKDKN